MPTLRFEDNLPAAFRTLDPLKWRWARTLRAPRGEFRIAATAWSPGARYPRPMSRGVSQFSFVLAGELREWAGGTEIRGGAGLTLIKPAATAHRDDYGPDGALVVKVMTTAPVDDLLPLIEPGRCWTDRSRSLSALVATLHPLLTGSGVADVLDLLSALSSSASLTAARHASEPPEWLSPALRRLGESVECRPSARELSELCGRHHKHVARVFASREGCTIAQWLRRRRVERAATALWRTGGSLSTIALDVGFADQSHMTRAFQRELGVTPGRYRMLLRALSDRLVPFSELAPAA